MPGRLAASGFSGWGRCQEEPLRRGTEESREERCTVKLTKCGMNGYGGWVGQHKWAWYGGRMTWMGMAWREDDMDGHGVEGG
eukprot:356348-Chlamydomonas_euryale.AAC.28